MQRILTIALAVTAAVVGVSAILMWQKSSNLATQLAETTGDAQHQTLVRSQLDEKYKVLQSEHQKIKAEYEQALDTKVDVRANEENLMAQVKLAYEKRNAALKAEEEAKASYEGLIKERDELARQVEDSVNVKEPLEEKVRALEHEIKMAGEEKAGATEKLEILEAKVGQFEKGGQAKKLKKKIKKIENEKFKLADELKDLKKRIEGLNQDKQELAKSAKAAQDAAANIELKLRQDIESSAILSSSDEFRQLQRDRDRLAKENISMHYNLATLFAENENYELAEAEFQRVVQLNPDDDQAHYNLGVIYSEKLVDRAGAVRHFRRYLELNPTAADHNWVRKTIASIQAWMGQERLS
jgi:chromosome segregation ATPase